MRIGITLGSIALALAGCVPAGGPGTTVAGGSDCIALFRNYDLLEFSVRRPDNRTIPPGLQLPIALIRQGGCITMTADLAGMEAVPVVPVTDNAVVINPIALHAGVVTSTADEVRAIAFFRARGVQTRTVGAAGLGRRIYLGPFATEGALTGARDAAIAAGFSYPYTAFF
jgi:hypothetical protein